SRGGPGRAGRSCRGRPAGGPGGPDLPAGPGAGRLRGAGEAAHPGQDRPASGVAVGSAQPLTPGGEAVVVPVAARSLAAAVGGLLVLTAWASIIGTVIVPRPVSSWLTRWVDRV